MPEESLGSLNDCYVIQENGKKALAITGGGIPLDVMDQDQTTDSISLFMAQILDTATIIADTSKDDEEVGIETTGVVPVVGNFLCMQESGKISQVEILTVTPIAGDQYTLGIAIPLDFAYTTAGGCSIQNVDMNVVGSAIAPITFLNAPIADTHWHIARIMFAMVLATAGDDGKFGNLSALTVGMYMRKENAATSQNLFNARDNSDIRIEGYDVTYPIRSGGGGDYGMAARITFNGKDKRGVAISLNGALGESIKAVVRDNLSTLGKFRIKIQGHVVLE